MYRPPCLSFFHPSPDPRDRNAATAFFALSLRTLGGFTLWLAAGCGGDGGGDGGTGLGDGGGICETDPGIDGEWDANLLDWIDPGDPGDPLKDPPYDDIEPHHPYLTPVHAAHLPTGELLMYHGQSDERLWTIDSPASDMQWVPIPYAIDAEHCSLSLEEGETCYPDIFCSGASLLETGELFVVGGNVTGGPDGGGLLNTYLFDPMSADTDVSPFGWTQGPDMQVDRWYPTVTEFATPSGPKYLISGGASLVPGGQNSFEVYDPVASTVTLLPVSFSDVVPAGIDMPTYPFIFQLPNGDLFYAGGEAAATAAHDGHVLIPDFNNDGAWVWDEETFASNTNGGSAVQYRPGKILKSGGIVGAEAAVPTTETIDLSDFASGDYANSSEFITRTDMNLARHFHTLTMLCDGRVLATGGNEKGNGELWHELFNPCDYPEGSGTEIKDMTCSEAKDCPAVWSKCVDGTCPALGGTACETHDDCAMTCTSNDDCPLGATCDGSGKCMGGVLGQSAAGVCVGGKCDPYHNACYATKAAEIWDPDCDEWVLLDEQQKTRMYHSTALLTPSCDVLSMGGGHRQAVEEEPNAEYFRPDYGTGFPPLVELVGVPAQDGIVDITYGSQPVVQIHNPMDVAPGAVNLLKLGSVTHQFDVSQLFVPLTAVWQNPWQGDMPLLTVVAPTDPRVAPPGYYMLVVLSDTGTPSNTQYVRLTGGAPEVFTCAANPVLEAKETSCTVEPIGGACPADYTQLNPVDLPRVDGPNGNIPGWQVFVPPSMVEGDPATPTPSELAAIEARCVQACQSEWSDPAVSANCDATGAFDTPKHSFDGSEPALDFILPSQDRGQNIFAGQQLSCLLGTTCFSEFDENLSRVVPSRPTPADIVIGDGEEYRIALGSDSKVEVITGLGSYESTLSGSLGYGTCTEGDASGPCAAYIGSLDAIAQDKINATLECDDGTQEFQTLENFLVQLGQPAFGIAEQGTTSKGFPSGALVLTSSFDIGRQHYTARRPNTANVVITTDGTTFAADNLVVSLRVPCNTTEAMVTVRYTLRSPSDGSAIAQPPTVSITTPSQVSCDGPPTMLQANASDLDDDLIGVRWRIDDVLMAPTTTSVSFTTGHVLAAIAEDTRGARTTVRKVLTCQ